MNTKSSERLTIETRETEFSRALTYHLRPQGRTGPMYTFARWTHPVWTSYYFVAPGMRDAMYIDEETFGNLIYFAMNRDSMWGWTGRADDIPAPFLDALQGLTDAWQQV